MGGVSITQQSAAAALTVGVALSFGFGLIVGWSSQVGKTRDAFIEGYERMLWQRTRDDKHWWLRIVSLEHFEPIVRGLEGQVPVDNARVHRIMDDLRDSRGPSRQVSSN